MSISSDIDLATPAAAPAPLAPLLAVAAAAEVAVVAVAEGRAGVRLLRSSHDLRATSQDWSARTGGAAAGGALLPGGAAVAAVLCARPRVRASAG